jgi:hypothetical protein
MGARVLILDEPTTGISSLQKEKLFSTLKLLAKQGKTVIFVSHKLEDIKQLVGWNLKISPDLKETEPPTEEQICIMRNFDPLGFVLGSKSNSKIESFDEFFEKVRSGYQAIKLNC